MTTPPPSVEVFRLHAATSADESTSTTIQPAPDEKPDENGLVQGPAIRQIPAVARLAWILHNAAEEMWDAAACEDIGQMWEEARAAASRVLAACPVD